MFRVSTRDVVILLALADAGNVPARVVGQSFHFRRVSGARIACISQTIARHCISYTTATLPQWAISEPIWAIVVVP